MQICWDKYLAQVTCLFECTKSFVSSRLRSYCRFPFVIWTFLTVRGRCHGVLNTQRSLQQNCNLIWKRKIFRLEGNQSWPLYPQRQALGSLLLECHGLFSPFIPRTCPLRRRTMLWLQWRGRLRLTWIYTRVTTLKGLWHVLWHSWLWTVRPKANSDGPWRQDRRRRKPTTAKTNWPWMKRLMRLILRLDESFKATVSY